MLILFAEPQSFCLFFLLKFLFIFSLLFCLESFFLLKGPEELMRIKFLHPDHQFSSQLRTLSFGLLNQDLLCEFQLDQLFLDPHRDPIRIDVYGQFRSLQMFWNVQGKYCILGFFKLLELEFESAFVTLPDFTFLVEHWAEFFFDEFLRISLFFFSHLVIIHFFIHFGSDFFGVASFHLISLFFGHVFLSLLSLSLLNLFLL